MQQNDSLRGFLVLTAGLLSATVPIHAQVSIETLALSAQSAPGCGNGVTFGTFAPRAAVSAHGESGLTGTILGPGVSGSSNSAVWVGLPGALTLIAREGTAAPGTAPGINFSGFGDPIVASGGALAFLGFLRGSGITASNDSGVWSGHAGSLGLVVREGGPAPGAEPGAVFEGIAGLVLNRAGHVAFFGVLSGPGISYTNDVGVWVGPPGGLSLLAREGDQAPGTSGGVKFASLYGPVLNDAGTVAFRSSISGGDSSGANDVGVWAGGLGTLALIARKGSPAPSTSPGVVFGIFSDPAINASGQIAFGGMMTGTGVNSTNDEGIWAGFPSGQTLVARKGAQAPGTSTGVVFGDLYDPVIGADGAVAFQARLSGPGVTLLNNLGVWCGRPGNLRLAGRTGSLLTEVGLGITLGAFVGNPILNGNGHIAYLSSLTGLGILPGIDTSIWLSAPDGSRVLVARAGTPLTVGPSDQRTVAALALVPSAAGGQDGRLTCLDDRARIVFHVTFTNGSQGVFAASTSSTTPLPDADSDGIVDASDNCPGIPNSTQQDADGDHVGDVCDACPATIPGAPVDASGCPAKVKPDFDWDGDVDADDLALLASCHSGSAVLQSHPNCTMAHLDDDTDVDQEDFGLLQRCYSGANRPIDPACER